ncbi:MAG: electron transport complex subunit RsxG [Methylophilaceae bacterium 17-44-8]|nr:MAG: electron transport complex subunit RsxG [Methylophilales bacterium 28-44-11]OYZ10675.1 MAG: electron transport complex subunit RsxG [Methylophilales bacterium 16-45-7]OZA06847.1 MAG: electron transport complex subunit RsxG [Methylophilaceae bacterium 17-44-8]
MPETIIRHASKTAITLMAFAIVFTTCMAFVYQVTKSPIEQSEAAARMSLFRQIMPEHLHDNDLLQDTIELPPDALLGTTQPTVANIARVQGQPSAIILEAIAHDGYSGDIKLLLAIEADGTLNGVRVITHKETPGLGDYIDIAKNNWIKLFDGQSLNNGKDGDWRVKKDGGKFDYMVGATITPRAVVAAVHKALQYVEQHKQTLFVAQVDDQHNAPMEKP